MREIQFRGKDLRSGEFIYGALVQESEKSYILPFKLTKGIPTQLEEVDPKTVGQFTGLKDKNGKEIYEGDILDVKFQPHYVERISWHGPPDARAIVFWDYAGFRLKCKGEEDTRYADWTDTDICLGPIVDMSRSHSEAIGNIHENPELV